MLGKEGKGHGHGQIGLARACGAHGKDEGRAAQDVQIGLLGQIAGRDGPLRRMDKDSLAVDFGQSHTGIVQNHVVGSEHILLGHLHAGTEKLVKLQKDAAQALPLPWVCGFDQDLEASAGNACSAGTGQKFQIGIVGTKKLLRDKRVVELDQFGQ